MSQTVQTSFRFSISSLAADALQVVQFTGEEEISRPFRFELLLAATDPALDLAGLVGETAQFTLDKDGAERILYGIVAEFYQTDMPVPGVYLYRAVLVPRLSRLQLSRQNQIYGTTLPLDVIGVVTAELGESAQQGGVARHGTLGLSSTDYDVRVTGSYPTRDYIVQYDETDYDFIARQLEHWGIFYFFDHSTGTDRIVFGDNNVNFGQIAAPQEIRYATAGGMNSAGTASVFDFFCRTRQVPTQLTLRDYNYRLPKLELLVQQTVDPFGFGWINEYDDHFRNTAEGLQLAKIRAEELLCRQTVYSGKSDCIRFEAGRCFGLTDHFRASFNREYLITGIKHQGAQGVYGVTLNGPGGQTLGYSNSFTAIPADTPFRPERLTNRPKIAGVMTGRIDGIGDGSRAEIDELGRYKVLLQFDLGGYPAGQASQYIRKAEPYSGPSNGMHFPLLKGTEVLIAHIDGDPDRPVILGAVPDAASLIVSNQGSNTRNRIVTPSGIFMEMNDGQGNGGSATGGANSNSLQQQAQGSDGGADAGSGVNAWQPPSNGLYNNNGSSSGGTWFRVGEPTTNGYFRIGSFDPSTESGLLPRMMCDNASGGKSYSGSGSTSSAPLGTSPPAGGNSSSGNSSTSSGGGASGGASGALMAAPFGSNSDNGTGAAFSSLGDTIASGVTSGYNTVASGVTSGYDTVAGAVTGAYDTASGAVSGFFGNNNNSFSANSGTGADGNPDDQGGALAYTNGHSYSKETGDKIDDVGGDKITQVDGNQWQQVNGNDWKWICGTETAVYRDNYSSTYWKTYEAYMWGNKFQTTVGAYEDTVLGAKISMIVGEEMKTNVGFYQSFNLAGLFKYTNGFDTSILVGDKTESITGAVQKTVTGDQTNIYTGDIKTFYTGVNFSVSTGDVVKNVTGDQINIYTGMTTTNLLGDILAVQEGNKQDIRVGTAVTITGTKCDQQDCKIDITNATKIENVMPGGKIVMKDMEVNQTSLYTEMGSLGFTVKDSIVYV